VSLSEKGTMLTHVLALVFFLISISFVYRSFYGMRIGSEVQGAKAAQAAAD
jgi:K(+)-stimulated pyrophosphate-energized sodium pump